MVKVAPGQLSLLDLLAEQEARAKRLPPIIKANGANFKPKWHSAVYGNGGGGAAWAKRAQPPKAIREEVLKQQGGCCFYCGNPFGALVKRPRRSIVKLKLNWDHFVPYAYLQRNPKTNWVAACHVCNGLKSHLMITLPIGSEEAPLTIQAARDFLVARWAEKGYRIA